MHIVIVGMGTTGTEIAQAIALSGNAITLHDQNTNTLRRSLADISRSIDHALRDERVERQDARRAKRVFRITTDPTTCASADLVIEAVPDTLDAKHALLRALDRIVRPNTILATSSILHPLTAIVSATRLPDRVIGLRFPKPAPRTGVVEIVQTSTTRQELIDETLDLMRSVDKTPLVMQDSPGLVVNRMAQVYFGEALSLLDDGSLDEKTIDRLMEAAGFTQGPFRQMDYWGEDRVFAVSRMLFEATFYATPYRPHPRLQRMTEAGKIGQRGSRGGFYPDKDDANTPG